MRSHRVSSVVEIKSAFDRLASRQEKIQRFIELGLKIALLIKADLRRSHLKRTKFYYER